MHGEADVLDLSVARATLAELGQHAPVRLAVLDDAGHMPFREAPASCFAAVESWPGAPILAHDPPDPPP